MFDTLLKNPDAMGQIVGAIIGVAGLVIGTFITILTSFIIRNMDIRREERKEAVEIERAKQEKAFALKQEIYSEFISELATIESFLAKKDTSLSLKNLENFDDEWTRIEIKVDLVADEEVRQLKDKLSAELLSLAKQKFAQKDSSKEIILSQGYNTNRSALLEAIRQDMELINQK